MSCSINFNRRGKKVEVQYIPDEEMESILAEQELLERIKRVQKQVEEEKKLLEEVE